MAISTILSEFRALAVTTFMFSNEVSPTTSASHFPVRPLGEETPPPDPTDSVKLQQAHTDGLVHGLEHTQAQANPNMPSSRCGHCNRTSREESGRTSREESGKGQGWDTCSR